MEPLATPEEVAARADQEWPLDSQDLKVVGAMIAEASALVRHHGLPWPTKATAPAVALTITIRAAAYGFMNPGGIEMERGDAVTFNRNEEAAAGLTLSSQDIAILNSYKPRTSLISVPTVNPDSMHHRSNQRRFAGWGYAPVHYGGKPFPLGVDP